MSVYHEALMSGRLTLANIADAGGSPRRALKKVKRREAEQRNGRTPYERTKQHRRALESLSVRIKAGRRG